MEHTFMKTLILLAVCCIALILPVSAEFTGTPTAGIAPLTVQFSDDSSNDPVSWNWSFGDGSIENATLQNPLHTYMIPGAYTVELNVTNVSDSQTTIRRNYINVHGPPPAVTDIVPSTGINTTSVMITNLSGYNFTAGAAVLLTPVDVNPILKGSISDGVGGALLNNPQSLYVSGNYAYVVSAGDNALEIVDVSDPANPVHKGSLTNGNGGALLSSPLSVQVSGNYAYIVSAGNNALEIVDISDPANPVHKGSIINGTDGALLDGPRHVYVSGNYAYVVSAGSQALEIVNISDPANPVHTGSIMDTCPNDYGEDDYGEICPWTGVPILYEPGSVQVSGNYAYILARHDFQPTKAVLEIVDVSDPANPVHKGSASFSAIMGTQSLYVSGNYAYAVGSRGFLSNFGFLEIVNISDPANPFLAGNIRDGVGGANLNYPASVYVSANYAYVGSGTTPINYDSVGALEIIDISDPLNPVHKGSYLTGTSGYDNRQIVQVSDDYAYVVSGGNNALQIVDIGTITATDVNVVSPTQITGMLDPTNKIAGQYNVVVVNPDGQFGLLAEGFNVTGAFFDLRPVEFNTVTQSETINGIPILWEVENHGNGEGVRNWTDAVYLSTDQYLDSGDIKLFSYRNMNQSLFHGMNYSLSEIIDYSNPVQSGIYYLILNIDDQNEIFEGREKNNAISRPLQIGAEQTFNENAAHQSSLVEDLKSQNLTLDNGQVTGELTGTFDLTSVELATITSGSFNGQGFFKGFFMSNLDTIEYFGNVKGVIVPDPKNNKILLKGTISGSEINGIVDGSLMESQPGTGIYNKLNATFRLNQLGGKNVSATLSMQGDISYTSETLYPSTKFKYLQSSASGTLVGDYSEPISLVLNSIRVDNSQSPFDSKGFSVLTYSTSSITGEGWTYDHEYMPGFVSIDGFCSSNAFLVSGGGRVGQFAFFTNSVNKGAAPAPDLEIKPIGPDRVSPGQRVTYGMEILNYGNAAGHEIESRITLSPDVYLVSASGDYYFDSRNHAVYWKDEIIPPRNTTIHTLTANVKLGLSQGTMIHNSILVKDTSKENNTFYSGILWNPDESGVKSLHTLLREYTASNLDADLKYSYYDTDVNNGSFHVWLASKNVETDKNYLAYHEVGKAYRIAFSHSGGTQTLYKKLESGDIHADYAVFAAPAFLHQQKIADLINQGKIKKAIIAQSQRDVLYLTKSKTGWMWYIKYIPSPTGGVLALPWYGPASQVTDTICALPVVWEPLGSLIPIDLVPYLDNTKPFPTSHDIVPKVPEESYIGSAYRSAQVPFMSEDLDHDGELDIIAINNSFPEIPESFDIKKLEPGATLVHGALIGWVGELYQKGDYPFNGSIKGLFRIESIDNKILPLSSQVLTAHDPNIKYGPFGYVQAGQRLEYKVEFENEGKGIAYGVYITDRLDPALDDSTLAITPLYSARDGTIIAPSGVYDATTRTIIWLAGEVGPGTGGYSNVSINVRNDAIDKTEITNYATVFFPSVPEETRTNTIFSRVGMNHPPNMIESLFPIDAATNISISRSVLSYFCEDPDGDVLSYDIYFGKQYPPPLVANSLSESFYYQGILEYNTTYYWNVVAKDTEGAITQSPVWSFRSAPPLKANFTVNSTYGVAPASIIFFDTSSGSPASWLWEFGDGTNSTERDLIHTYQETGIYSVNLTVEDIYGKDVISKTNYITVNNPIQNTPPLFTNPGDQIITERKTLSLNLIATDPDKNSLTYSFTSTKTLSGAIISGNTFTWTPGSGTAGTYPVKFIVTDTGGLSDEEAINITVNAPVTNVPTTVKIVPKTINIGSKGYFLAFVTLPEAYKGATIDKDSISCSGAPAVRMMKLKLFPRIVGFVFKTSALNNVEVGKRVTLTVKGELKNKGTTYTFTGSDDVKVISKPSWQPDDIKDVSKESDDQLFKKFNT